MRIESEQTMKELLFDNAGPTEIYAAKIVGRTADEDLYDQFLKEVGGSHEDTDDK